MQGRRNDMSRGQQGRLPIIAPRSGATFQPGHYNPSNPSPETRRNRLPPRSRSGCWTCRTRKVKCDEKRPACDQCVRLGHICPSDYSARLSFRDDTPRIVERMQEVSTIGSIWDPNLSGEDLRRTRSVEDSLPPFSSLTSDEERERKAESQEPGTYHVIANPHSFASLPEYKEEPVRRNFEITNPKPFDQNDDSDIPNLEERVHDSDDPNTIILRTFEDSAATRIAPAQFPLIRSSRSSVSHVSPTAVQTYPLQNENQRVSMLDEAREGGKDRELLEHYRNMISPRIIRVERTEGDEDIFEIQARHYPPLFHAMMALSALSLAHRQGVHRSISLEHYQQVIPALQMTVQSSQDSYSDGALFTHFILLLYEIAAVNRESNMWQHHCDQLLRIITLRRQANAGERYGFIVWAVYCIDIYALLSGSGSGSFADVVLREDMVPSPYQCLPSAISHLPHVFSHDEEPYFPAVIRLHQEVMLLALQIGHIARDLRAETNQIIYHGHIQPAADANFRNRVREAHNLLHESRSAWRTNFPDYWTWLSRPEPTPLRVFTLVQHSYMLFRACSLFAYTSMYSGQLLDQGLDFPSDVATCCQEIIQAAQNFLSQNRDQISFILFPLFMAGFATTDGRQKQMVLELMTTMEQYSFGSSTRSVKRLLETIYHKQQIATFQTGNASSIDWLDEVGSSGLRLIIYWL